MTAFWKTKITFFDIPTLASIPTSPNTWKVRLVLNFKGLEYETRWVPTVDIESVCKSLKIPPTGTKSSGEPHFTLPALIDYTRSSSEPVIISDSTPIIQYLEHTYPSPSRKLFPVDSEPEYLVFEAFIRENIMKYLPSLWFMENYNAKPPRDKVHFRERMEKMFGKKLEDIELQGSEREEAYNGLQQAFLRLSGYFPNGKDGDYITGKTISFPDFTVCGFLLFMKGISPDDAWKRIASWEDGKWGQFFQLFEGWMAVDHHPTPTQL